MEHMKPLRQNKGLSVGELAEKCNVSATMIWNYESGRREPPLSVLCAIADALDVSLDVLVRGKEKDRPEERSLDAMTKHYRELSEEQLDLLIAVLQAVRADKRFQAHMNRGTQETP